MGVYKISYKISCIIQIWTLIFLFPKLEPNEIFAEVILLILSYIKRQLEITDINFRRIYEHEWNLPNDDEKFKTFKMYADFITNFRGDLKINYNFISEDSRS